MNAKEKDAFFERLFEVLDEETQSWWAKTIGLSQGTISNIYKKKFMPADKLVEILKAKKISADWLFFNIGSKKIEHRNASAIDKMQDNFREAQNKFAGLERENIKLRKERKIHEAASGLQAALPSPGDFLNAATSIRMIIDLVLRMALEFAKQNIDDDKLIEIFHWLKRNHDVKKFGTAAAMEELNQLFDLRQLKRPACTGHRTSK